MGFAPRQGDLLIRLRELQIDDLCSEQAGLVSIGQTGRSRTFYRSDYTFQFAMHWALSLVFLGANTRKKLFRPSALNTPETPLFKKSHVLFGLSYCRQRIAKEKQAIIVEGQVDALS